MSLTCQPKQFVKYLNALLLTLLLSNARSYSSRSLYRQPDQDLPTIKVTWLNGSAPAQLSDSHFKAQPLFKTFDRKYFQQHLLPKTALPFRQDPTQTVTGAELSRLIENFLVELRATQKIPKKLRLRNFKQRFTDFTILKCNEFYPQSFSGLIVAKFKKYPFILKLLVESPQSLTRPYHHGIYAMGIFTLSGACRHIIGFSRVKNSEYIMQRAATDSHWAQRLTVPKKWFWLPAQPQWLKITGYHIGQKSPQTIVIPAIYAVIAEEIQCQEAGCKPDPKECLACSAFLKCATDPNYSNFRIETQSGKLAIIDTEHFPLLMGLDENNIRPFKTYKGFYSRAAMRFIHRKLFQDKRTRRANQYN